MTCGIKVCAACRVAGVQFCPFRVSKGSDALATLLPLVSGELGSARIDAAVDNIRPLPPYEAKP